MGSGQGSFQTVSAIDPDRPATPAENALIWDIPSRTDPHVTYKVELDSYSGNGECPCDDFAMRFQKLLCRRITPQQALDQGLVKLRPKQHPEDALRCWHIVDARRRLNDHLIEAFSNAQKIHSPQKKSA